jgi:hypothetical protein
MLSDELQPGAGQLDQASEEWVVDVTSLVYDVYGAANTASSAAIALGLQSMAFQDPRNVNITNGDAVWDVLRVDRQPQEPTDAVPLAFAQSALVASGLPFTEPGDLLVHLSPSAARVAHKGSATNGMVFRRDFTWVAAGAGGGGLDPSIIATDYVVAVGPVEHPTAHDLWFPTLDGYNAWVAGKRVLASLTILPNGFAAEDGGNLNLPETFNGGLVTLGQPVQYATGGSSAPLAAITLAGRNCYIQSDVLSLFYDYQLVACDGDIGTWHLQADANNADHSWPGENCNFSIGTVVVDVQDDPNTIFEAYNCKLDIGLWSWSGVGTYVNGLTWRFHDSDVYIQTVNDLGTATYNTAKLMFTNSNLYVQEELDSTRFNVVLIGLNAHIHLASGVVFSTTALAGTAEPLIRTFASNVIVPMTRFFQPPNV